MQQQVGKGGAGTEYSSPVSSMADRCLSDAEFHRVRLLTSSLGCFLIAVDFQAAQIDGLVNWTPILWPILHAICNLLAFENRLRQNEEETC